MKPNKLLQSVKKSTTDRFMKLYARSLGSTLNGLDRLSPRLAVRLAYALFGRTRRFPARSSERRWLERSKVHTIRHGGRRLMAHSWGEGPTLLLVHGWNGRGTQLEAFIAPLLARGFRVVAMDASAHGQSEGSHTNLFDFADSVRAVGTAVGPLAGVLTHSMGGAATTLALVAGMRAERLVFIAPPTNPRNWVDQFSKTLGLTPKLVDHFLAYLTERFGHRWHQVQTLELQSRREESLLVIHDREDREVSYRGSEELVKFWPDARLILTEGLGHFRILQEPAVIERAVGFLSEKPEIKLSEIPWKGGNSDENTAAKNPETLHPISETLVPA